MGPRSGGAINRNPSCYTSNPIVTFTTSMGKMDAEIYLDRVPRTASNFIDLAKSGFFNGLHFHRVVRTRCGRRDPIGLTPPAVALLSRVRVSNRALRIRSPVS